MTKKATFHFSNGKTVEAKLLNVDIPNKAEIKLPMAETDSEPVSIIKTTAQASFTFELTRWQSFQVQTALLTVPIWESKREVSGDE